MLNIISLQDGRKGVIDSEENELIVPAEYTDITIQKYGIVARDSKNICSIFQLSGKPIVRALENALLLDNNLVLTATPNGVCYIVDYVQRQYVSQLEVDSILFFYGSNNYAEVYSLDKDFSSVFNKPDYLKFGAHLENLVGVRSRKTHKWGVYNIQEQSLYCQCTYEAISQFSGNIIAALSDAGTIFQL